MNLCDCCSNYIKVHYITCIPTYLLLCLHHTIPPSCTMLSIRQMLATDGFLSIVHWCVCVFVCVCVCVWVCQWGASEWGMCTCKVSGDHPYRTLFYVEDISWETIVLNTLWRRQSVLLPIPLNTLLTLPHTDSIINSLLLCIVIIAYSRNILRCRPAMIFMHGDLGWDQLQLMISRSTTADLLKMFYKLEEFFSQQFKSSKRVFSSLQPRTHSKNSSFKKKQPQTKKKSVGDG